jgi:hypothetical protein
MCPANGWLSHGSALASRVIVPAISKHSDEINGNQHALASRVIVPAISMHSDAINRNQEQSSTIGGHQGHSDANRGIKGGNQGRQSREAIKCNQVHSIAVPVASLTETDSTPRNQVQSSAIKCNQVHSIAVPVASLTETDSTPRTARDAISILSASRPLCSGGAIRDACQSREGILIGVLIRRLTRLSLERES